MFVQALISACGKFTHCLIDIIIIAIGGARIVSHLVLERGVDISLSGLAD